MLKNRMIPLLPVILGFLLLGAVAVAGWVRTPGNVAADNLLTATETQPAVAPATRAVQPVRTYRAAPQRYVASAPVVQKRKRPFSHSAAIVAGSAGAGAAIGGIAGGGKGAAIGALSGGAAGFIYDRLTHNK